MTMVETVLKGAGQHSGPHGIGGTGCSDGSKVVAENKHVFDIRQPVHHQPEARTQKSAENARHNLLVLHSEAKVALLEDIKLSQRPDKLVGVAHVVIKSRVAVVTVVVVLDEVVVVMHSG